MGKLRVAPVRGKPVAVAAKPVVDTDEESSSGEDEEVTDVAAATVSADAMDESADDDTHGRLSCPSEGCTSKIAPNLSSLASHLANMHSIIQCGVTGCGQTFKGVTPFQLHCRRDHLVAGILLGCSKKGCHEKFSSKTDLLSHLEQVHNKSAVVKCTAPDCEEVFASKNSMREHRKAEHPRPPQAPVPCTAEGCGQVFDSKKSLIKHKIESHPLPPVPCDVEGCGQVLYSKKTLAAHKRTDHGAPGSTYPCDVEDCAEVFANKNGLNRHKTEVHKIPGLRNSRIRKRAAKPSAAGASTASAEKPVYEGKKSTVEKVGRKPRSRSRKPKSTTTAGAAGSAEEAASP